MVQIGDADKLGEFAFIERRDVLQLRMDRLQIFDWVVESAAITLKHQPGKADQVPMSLGVVCCHESRLAETSAHVPAVTANTLLGCERVEVSWFAGVDLRFDPVPQR